MTQQYGTTTSGAAGRSFAQRGLVRRGLALLTLGVALVPGLATAQSFTVLDGQTVGQQEMTGIGDIGVIELGGAVDTPNQTAVRMLADAQVLDNFGDISATGYPRYAVEAVGDSIVIRNYGTMSANGSTTPTVVLTGDGGWLTNFGLIEAEEFLGVGAQADGADALIENFGTIAANGVYGIGIRLNGANGMAVNRGEIVAGAVAATGIYTLGAGAVVENAGSIILSGGSGEGIAVYGPDSTVRNSGLIHTTGSSADGIVGVATSAINTGTILMEGTSGSTGISSYAAGALLRNEGTIQQSGSWSVGMQGYGNNATIENLGVIDITGNGQGLTGSGDDQYLFNAGTVRITSGGYAIYGMGARAEIENRGSIAVSGNTGYGIYAAGGGQTVRNSGSITTNGSNGHGIMVLEPAGFVENTGRIAAAGNFATGVLLNSAGSTLVNSGFISAEQDDAIRFWAGGGALHLLAGTVIDGSIAFYDTGNMVHFGPGLSARLTFSGAGLPATVTTSGNPYLVDGNTVTVFDRSGLALTDDMLFSLAGSAGGSSAQGLEACLDSGGAVECGVSAWLAGFGGVSGSHGSDDVAGYRHGHGGLEAGIDIAVGGVTAGAFLSGVAAVGEIEAAQETEMSGGVIGGHVGFAADGLFADLSASFGVLDMTSRRQVADNMVDGGVNTAEATSLGRFLSPALTAGTHIALGEQVLTPSATLRYTQLDLEGYTETGATDDFAIDARTASELALRAQLALTLAPMLTEGGEIVWSFRAGADASRREGMVTAMLVGEEIGFEAGSAGDAFGALVGANLDYRIGDSVNLSGDVEYTLDTAGSGAVTARASLSAAF